MRRPTTIMAATGLALGLLSGTAGLATAQPTVSQKDITGAECIAGGGEVTEDFDGPVCNAGGGEVSSQRITRTS